MKKITLLITAIIFSAHVFSQAPNWLWAAGASGTNWDHAYSLATDASGNVLATGHFSSPSLTFGTTTLTTNGSYDIFIAKYDGSGNFLWAKSAGGTNADLSFGISTDANGNVLVTGWFSSSSITFGTTTLTNAGGRDIFIVKYDAAGNVLWAKSAGGNNDEEGAGISADLNGNVLVTGYFKSNTITFGATTLTNTSINNLSDIFIAKYDASGNVLWAKGAGGTLIDQGTGISADASGNVYATGVFGSSNITFGAITLTISFGGGTDTYAVKYDANGNVLWAKGAGGGYCYGSSADASGNLALTGAFYTSFTFGATTLTGLGNNDIFVAKYNSSGNELWAKGAGGPSYDYGYRIATDANGNVLATGSFQSPTITFGSTTLTMTGTTDIFVVKYDPSGNVVWAKGATGTGLDVGYGIDADASGNVFVTGGFYNAPITFGTTTLTNAGIYDVFIAKLSGAVGVNEINGDKNFLSLFPNPATDKIGIEFPGSGTENRIETLEIFNTLGEKVYDNAEGFRSNAGTSQTNTETINISKLTSGIYFVRVRTSDGMMAGKFVKE